VLFDFVDGLRKGLSDLTDEGLLKLLELVNLSLLLFNFDESSNAAVCEDI
jgi:hypothetical protein